MPPKSIEPKEKPRLRVRASKVLSRAEPRQRVAHNLIRSTTHKIRNALSTVIAEAQVVQSDIDRIGAMPPTQKRRHLGELGKLHTKLKNLRNEEEVVREEYLRWDDHYQWAGGDQFMPPPPPPPPGGGGGIAV